MHDQAVCCIAGVPIFTDPTKQNCLALLAVVSVLWCTEALPLYVTSMLVPFLAVLLRVMVDRSGKAPRRMSAPDAADAILKSMFSQVWYCLPLVCQHWHTELPLDSKAWLQLLVSISMHFCEAGICLWLCAIPPIKPGGEWKE